MNAPSLPRNAQATSPRTKCVCSLLYINGLLEQRSAARRSKHLHCKVRASSEVRETEREKGENAERSLRSWRRRGTSPCQRSCCSWCSRRWLSARRGLWLERNCPERPPRASPSSGSSGRYIGSGLTGQATRARLGTQTVGADELQKQPYRKLEREPCMLDFFGL